MRRSGFILIVAGLLLAIISVIGVLSLSQRQTTQSATPTPIPIIKVVVAVQSIPERTQIQANMLTLKDWPADLVPAGTSSKPQDFVGKVSSAPLVAGEIVLLSKVSTEQATVGLAPQLPPGLVAMSLGMSPVNAVAGAIRVGDSVDILVSTEYSMYNEQGDESKPMQATFYTIQDVPVIATSGQSEAAAPTGSTAARTTAATSSTSAPNMLTILVTPQDALMIKYAREKGSIDLVLRSPQFHDQVTTDPVYLEYIMRRFELPRPLLISRDTGSTGEAE